MDQQVATTAGGMVLGTVLTIVVNFLLAFAKDKRAADAESKKLAADAAKAERADGREDMREVLDRTVLQLNEVRAELRECHGEHAETRDRCSTVERGFARAVAWIEALQYQLDHAGVRYPRFTADPTGDSAPHAALPITPKPELPK